MTNSYFGMREFLGTGVKKIATYDTGSSTMQQEPFVGLQPQLPKQSS